MNVNYKKIGLMKIMAKTKRTPINEQHPNTRIENFDEVVSGYSETEAIQEAKRCLQCKRRPCVDNCPIRIDIPEFIKLIAQNKFVEAGVKIKESHLFPAVCGRVCPQELQCEAHCMLAKMGEPIAIGTLERFAGDYLGKVKHQGSIKLPPKNGKNVAVVGSGPAGLTVASELIRNGFNVTMFEALHKLGGVLTYGIPDFRLPKQILQEELNQLEKYGVKIVTNFVIGKTATVDELLGEHKFDAVFIGSGAGLPTFMNIPGEYSTGVYSANEYLTRVYLMRAHLMETKTEVMRGNTVVVGGGNIAMDAARTAVRLGAKKTTLVYRRSEKEMPARLEEVKHAKEEGIDFQLLTNPTEILEDNKSMVKGIRCVKMQLDEVGTSGRRSVSVIPGSDFEIPCDVVVMAIGNKSNPLIQASTDGLMVSPHGTILSEAGDGRTSKPFVYTAGDVLTGAATVISAIGTGKRAAQSIMEDLGGLNNNERSHK
jgi:glutamate synthase (NADPH) small chain